MDENAAIIVVGCQEEEVKCKRRKVGCNSKFRKCLFECLRDKKHSHMLYFSNVEKTQFIVIFTDKKSPHWKEQDITLFKELDAVFPKKRAKAKYELTCKNRFKANMKKLCKSKILKEVENKKVSFRCEKTYEICKFPIGDCKKEVKPGSKLNCVNTFDYDKTCYGAASFANAQMTSNREFSHYACLSEENQVEARESRACMIKESSEQLDNVIPDVQNMETLIQPDVEARKSHIYTIREISEQLDNVISDVLNMEVFIQPGIEARESHACMIKENFEQLDNVRSDVQNMEIFIQPDIEARENHACMIKEDFEQLDNVRSDVQNMEIFIQPDAKLVESNSSDEQMKDLNNSEVYNNFNGFFPIHDCLLDNENKDCTDNFAVGNGTQYLQDDLMLFGNISSDKQMKDFNNSEVYNDFRRCRLTDANLFENNPEVENVTDSNNLPFYVDPDNFEFQNDFNKNMKSLENPMLSSAVENEDMLEAQPCNHLECSSLEEEEWMLQYSNIEDAVTVFY